MPKSKILFIDASVYINCALQEAKGSDCEALEKIFEKIESRDLILLLPEITQNEVLFQLKFKFNELENNLLCVLKPIKEQASKIKEGQKNKKQSKLHIDIINKLINENEKSIKDAISKEYKKSLDIITRIFSHKNIYKIPLTDKLILDGMKRSLLKKPPFREIKSGKMHTKDQDCIAFECQLYQLLDNKELHSHKYIICVDDSDYLDKEKKLYPEIAQDLKRYCQEVTGYNNLLEMLKEEFKAKYSDEDIKSYETQKQSAGGLLDYVNLSLKTPIDTIELKRQLPNTISDYFCLTGPTGPTPTQFSIDSNTSQLASCLVNRYCKFCSANISSPFDSYCPKCGKELDSPGMF